jgi:O-acetyl-ADP-ribose deacetylase (regulator of RNase III)
MKAKVVDGDLLDQDVDVIVNAWNRNFIPWWLLLPQGVSGAIKKKGGYAPFREVRKYGLLPLGGAALTSAGELPQEAIIHVAGLHAYWVSSEKSIRLSVRNAMEMADEYNYKSIAFPLIGAGTGGKKEDKVLAIMQDELDKLNYNIDVRIVRYRVLDAGAAKAAKASKEQVAPSPEVNLPTIEEPANKTFSAQHSPENRSNERTR